MDYKPMLDAYKGLFLKYSGGKPIDFPPDEFLVMALRMQVYLQEQGEVVEAVVGGGNLYLSTRPSEIGVGVSPEEFSHREPPMLWTWFKPESSEYYEQRCVWTGEWSSWIGEILGYKRQIEISPRDIAEFNPEKTAEKLLRISAKYMGSFPEIKATLDELEANREKLYSNVKEELAKILK